MKAWFIPMSYQFANFNYNPWDQPVGQEHLETLPNLGVTGGRTRTKLQLGSTCLMLEKHSEFFHLLVHAMSMFPGAFCYLHPQSDDALSQCCAPYETGDQNIPILDLSALSDIVPERVPHAPYDLQQGFLDAHQLFPSKLCTPICK
jgi:hypothetical protein